MTSLNEVVGRDAELAAVSAFLDRARAGPAALLLSGPAGIGKSTIWRAAGPIAARRELRVLEVRGAEAEARLPFSGLIDLLDPVADLVTPQLPAVQSAGLAVALRRAAPGDIEPDPLTVSLATLGTLKTLCAEQPVLIAIDDVQWLDATSLRTLTFAARRLHLEPVGWLVTVRTGHADASSALMKALPEGSVDEIEVCGLPLVALERLLRERLGTGFLRPTLLRIERTSAGNPFLALELGRALLRRGLHVTSEGLAVPEDMRGLLRDRLAALSAEASEAVLVAAALSAPTRGVMEALRHERVSEGGLREAIRAGVLEADGERVRFTHPLLASVAYDNATDEKRRDVHARIARVAADPEERARHLALSSHQRRERVARTLEEAAQLARNRGSPEAAAELADLARRRTPAQRVDDARRRGIVAARYLAQAGDPYQARTILEDLLETTPAGPARAEVLVRLADTHRGDDWETTTRLLREAAEQAGESLPRIAAERRLASAEWMTLHDVRAGREHARLALRLAEHAGDPAELAASLLQLAWLDSIVDGTVRGDLLERTDELQARLPSAVTESLINGRGLIVAWAGDLDGAREAFRTTRAEALRTGDWHALVHPLFELANVELISGNWDRALAFARDAEDVAHQIGNRLIDAIVLSRLAEVSAHLGRAEEARRAGERGLALSRQVGAGLEENGAQCVLGFLELSLGDAEAAHRRIGPAIRQRLAAGVRNPAVLGGLPNDVEALVMLGRLDEAAESLGPFEEQARRLDQIRALATSARCRGLLLAAAGDAPSAVRTLEAALALDERATGPFERARTLLVLGEVERRDRRRGAARRSLRAALTIFEELGARLWAERARRSLMRIEQRGTAGMTETDLRIIELVAAGQTNRQVAAALFMSPHTVDTHLRRIYRTLGVRSRTQLARRASAGVLGSGSRVETGS